MRKGLEKVTTLWITKELRSKLYPLKKEKENWDEMLTRLLVPEEIPEHECAG